MALKRTIDSSAALNWAAPPRSGYYFYPVSGWQAGTSNALGVGTLRLAPWYLPVGGFTLTRLGGDIATIGDVGSTVRLGIYGNVPGDYYPGPLIVDAGTIPGDVAQVSEVTISVTLLAGLYWIGGVVQAVTTTQPTVRIINQGTHQLVPVPTGTTIPAANSTIAGFSTTGVTGALPSTFPAGAGGVLAAPRVIAKTA